MNIYLDKSINPSQFSPITLAYIGDCVYELFVISKMISENGNIPSKKLHKYCVSMVRASFQSQIYFKIQEILNEEEKIILKRGRNANGMNVPRNSNVSEYRLATGVECLFGYLYLNRYNDRLEYIFNFIYEFYKKEKKELEKV